MAYNLQPLITILEQILDPEQNRWILEHNKPQLQSLHETVASLLQILEKSPLTNIENLETRIRISAHKAEDIIESNMVDMMLSNPQNAVRFTFSTQDLQQVMQELDYVMKQVVKLIEEKTISSGMPVSHDLSSSSIVDHSVQSKAVVGLDDALSQLKERVMEMQSKLEIVPIIGMGGIGKTTLARELYQDPCIVDHFPYLAWATVSQDYNMKAILLSLLRCITGCDQHTGKESHELKDILYRNLFGRRYIIVLDDIWNIEFWDEIRRYLPDNNEGSRIMITTRESEVAKHANSGSVQHHQMQLLSKPASWDLLRQIVFGEEGCPDFLQGIGEKIARDCGGLPLAISVIGGILSDVERSKHGWENIANNVADAIAEADERFSNILSLSYNHLPNHLKPCFLYMGAFPEDYKIKGSRLVHLWVAEGFVKSNGIKSLEEVAEDWLKALVERNLFLVRKYKYGKPRLFGMHDLLRDLCIRKSNEEQFLCVKNNSLEAASSNPRRVCVHLSGRLLKVDNASAKSMSLARSFILICDGFHQLLFGAILTLRLLRVLDLMNPIIEYLPEEIFELVNLRFLALYAYSGSSRGILRLRNLRTFVNARNYIDYLPPEIFEMSELRHLKLRVSICTKEGDMKKIVPNKLRTIYKIELTDSLIRSGFLESIPDIEKLGFVCSDDLTSNAVDLTHLHKLKALRLHFYPVCRVSLSAFRFPSDLRKLHLAYAVILQSDMKTLSALPNLEVLEIRLCKFESEETSDKVWEVAEGVEFCSLQVLYLRWMYDLERWRADESNFPKLRYLHLDYCWMLEEIPSGIGEIPTLQSIKLVSCSNSAEASARQIVEEQQSEYGNYNLKLHITSIPICNISSKLYVEGPGAVMEPEPVIYDASGKDDERREDEGRSGRPKRRIREPKKYEDFISYR